jgi:type II secretory pathway pseudopilin PulG
MINQKGQSLVEALVALGVATIVVSAMAVAAITAVNNSDFSKYQNQATQYAQQGIEYLRQLSENDWSSFSSHIADPNGVSCLSDVVPLALVASDNGSCSSPNIRNEKGNKFFVRQVQLTNVPYSVPAPSNNDNIACNGVVKVTVTVSWTDGKCGTLDGNQVYCHSVVLNSCLDNVNATQ